MTAFAKDLKRKRQDEPNSSGSAKSKAFRFNIHTLRKLDQAMEANPEVDLTLCFPKDYSERLSKMRTPVSQSMTSGSVATTSRDSSVLDDDIRVFLRPSDPITVIFPLSSSVRRLVTGDASTETPKALMGLMQRCEIVWRSPFPRKKMVFRCDGDIVIKAIKDAFDYTEYTTLRYLEEHKPNIPAPRPLGLLRVNDVSLIFMSYIPQLTLADVWPGLDLTQKMSVREQLGQILTDLRTLPHPDGMPLGGVGGEGCKDVRRHLRRSTEPILTIKDFEDFLFPACHAPLFTKFVRRLSPPGVPFQRISCVFTHGDLRPDNITVKIWDKEIQVTGLLDWEYSGFYPEYYESIKCTNGLALPEDDWYFFIPKCVSLERYAWWWLRDHVRGALVE